jgi:hypothetical protein
MLRRAFSGFDAMERRRLLDEVRTPSDNAKPATDAGDDPPGFAKSLPLLKQILGLP